MGCEHTRAVLLGESPPADTSDHLSGCEDCQALAADLAAIDAEFADLAPPPVPADLIAATRAAMAAEVALESAVAVLPTPPVPAGLVAQTRAAMAAEIAPNVVPLWRRPGVVAAVAVAAAVLVFVLPSPQQPGNPTDFVEKGGGDTLPDLALGVAVRSGDTTERLRLDQSYAPGDVLYFRSSTDRSAEVLLVRIDAAGADVIHRQEMGPGNLDLPLSWTLESSETDAVFALLAGPAPADDATIESALVGAWPNGACKAALPLSLSCESVFVDLDVAPDTPEEAP